MIQNYLHMSVFAQEVKYNAKQCVLHYEDYRWCHWATTNIKYLLIRNYKKWL